MATAKDGACGSRTWPRWSQGAAGGDWIEQEVYTLVATDVRQRRLEGLRYQVRDAGDAFVSFWRRSIRELAIDPGAPLDGGALPADGRGAPTDPRSLVEDEWVRVAHAYVRQVTLVRRTGSLDLELIFYDEHQGPPGEWDLRFTDVRDGRFLVDRGSGIGIGYRAIMYLDAQRRDAEDHGDPRFRISDAEGDFADFTCGGIAPIPVSVMPSDP